MEWLKSVARRWWKYPLALKVGQALTCAWLLAFGRYWWTNYRAVVDQSPSNFGDFLAGWFAPMAFLWLVVAVFLQKRELRLQWRELRHSKEALRQQANATADLVKQTEESVRIANQSLADQQAMARTARLNTMIDELGRHVALQSGRVTFHVAVNFMSSDRPMGNPQPLKPLGESDVDASVDQIFWAMELGLGRWRRLRERVVWHRAVKVVFRLEQVQRHFENVLSAIDASPTSDAATRAELLKLRTLSSELGHLLIWLGELPDAVDIRDSDA